MIKSAKKLGGVVFIVMLFFSNYFDFFLVNFLSVLFLLIKRIVRNFLIIIAFFLITTHFLYYFRIIKRIILHFLILI